MAKMGNLILTRRVNEALIINEESIVRVAKIFPNFVKLSIQAPPNIIVDRMEIYQRKLMSRLQSSESLLQDEQEWKLF